MITNMKQSTKRATGITLLLLLMNLCVFADFNVRDYGAKGDGKALDSPAIFQSIRMGDIPISTTPLSGQKDRRM